MIKREKTTRTVAKIKNETNKKKTSKQTNLSKCVEQNLFICSTKIEEEKGQILHSKRH